jgi:hypothetical protein
MSENDDFARIALAEGFCTQDQIDRCRRIQSNTDERLSLGQSLLREGFLTQEQFSRALVLLRQGYKRDKDIAVVQEAERRLEEARASARQGQEDRVLRGIVLERGWIRAELLKVSQELAAKRGRPLAEILVALGHLDQARVDAILGRLERMDLSCPSCKAILSVVRLPTGDSVRCPRCGKVVPQGAG